MPLGRKITGVAALLFASGVCFGAIGAHAVRSVVTPERLDIFEKAVFYQFIGALGVLLTGLLCWREAISQSFSRLLFGMFLASILLFSGSLYLLVLLNQTLFALFAPLGGGLLIISWSVFAFRLLRDEL
jgi:uncharacterized membrane protein YgdD (TMEM256/DUF423 family)